MKKIVFAALCLFFALALPCLCFADGAGTPAEENIVGRVMNVVWYVILVVLFGGGLILVSKWSKRINERDAELEQQLQQMAEEESKAEETEAAKDGDPQNDQTDSVKEEQKEN